MKTKKHQDIKLMEKGKVNLKIVELEAENYLLKRILEQLLKINLSQK